MRKINLLITTLIILITLSLLQPLMAKAPEVKFSDAWFGEVDRKMEVAPGDKGVQLVIRMINAWNKTFRYADGQLYLPEGFRDSVTGESVTRPHVVQSPRAGTYFYLKFLIDIGEDVQVGEYMAKLWIRYVFWDEEKIEHSYIYVKFRVTGKSELKFSLNPEKIEPDEVQRIKLIVKNDGSARASSLTMKIESITNGLAILKGQGIHIIGDLEPGESSEIPLEVFASRGLADKLASLKIVYGYLDSYGQLKEEEEILPIRVSPLGGMDVVLDARVENPILKPAKINDLTIIVRNNGVKTARSVDISISLPEGLNPPITLIDGAMSAKIGNINAEEERTLKLKVFVNQLAAGKSFTIPVQLTYADDEGRHVITRPLTVTVVEESRRKRLSIYCNEYVKGGVIEEVEVRIKNIAGEDLSDLTLTLSPEVGWVTLLGPTTWHINHLADGEEESLRLKMYVPSETSVGSTIGEPFNLRVEVSFQDSSGLIRNEVHKLGMYVRGIIDIRLQEIKLEKIGSELYLVGRLLNEGTETAYYTRIGIMEGDLSSDMTSYLGDLNPNAPLLFSLPIKNVSGGKDRYHVKLLVTYMNSLRERSKTVIEAEVSPPKMESQQSQATGQSTTPFILIGGFSAAVIIAAIYIARRMRGIEAS